MNTRHPVGLFIFACASLLASRVAIGQFAQQGPKLVGTGSVAVGGAGQGISVAISADGNTAIVGGSVDNDYAGAAWVWRRSGGVWVQQGPKLVGSGAVGAADQGIGVAMSADGNTAIVGGPGDNGGMGAAWIWTRSSGAWTQQGSKLVGSDAIGAARQGGSVALSSDGNTAIVGGYGDNINTGAAWVWTRSGGVWSQQGAKLVRSDAVSAGPYASSSVSVSLSSDGDTAIVGVPFDNAGTGAAWVWTRSRGVWTQQGAKLVGSDGSQASQGLSVSLSADGNTAIVGGPGDFHGYTTGGGAVWVWTRKEGRWSQQGTKLIGLASLFPESGDRSRGTYSQGYSVSLSGDGDTAIVGAPSDPTKIVGPFSTPPTGAAWIWKRSDGIWLQQGTQLVVSDGMWTSQGSSVALSADGKTAIVGGPSVYDGAAWVFDASAVPPRRRGVNH